METRLFVVFLEEVRRLNALLNQRGSQPNLASGIILILF